MLTALRMKISELRYCLEDWKTAVLVTIYKKGRRTDLASYRPLSLLSHYRKIVKAVISAIIRKDYSFHEVQLGFQHTTRTEAALVKHAFNCRNTKYSVVLDLKLAYDTVPRDTLMSVL